MKQTDEVNIKTDDEFGDIDIKAILAEAKDEEIPLQNVDPDNPFWVVKVHGLKGNEEKLDDFWRDGVGVELASGEVVSFKDYVTATIFSKQTPASSLPELDFILNKKKEKTNYYIKQNLEASFSTFFTAYNLDANQAWDKADAYLNEANGDDYGVPVSAVYDWADCVRNATRAILAGNQFHIASLARLDGKNHSRWAQNAHRLKNQILEKASTVMSLKNTELPKENKIKRGSFTLDALAEIITSTGDVRFWLKTEDSELIHLFIYQYAGPDAGMWTPAKINAPGPLSILASEFLGKSDKATMEKLFGTIGNMCQANDLMIQPLGLTRSWFAPVRDGVVDVRKDLGRDDYCKHTGEDGLPNAEYTRRFKIVYQCDPMTLRSQAFGIMHRSPVPYDPNAADPVFVAPDGYEWSVERHLDEALGHDKIQRSVFLGWAGRALRGEGDTGALLMLDDSKTSGGGGGKGTLGEMFRSAAGGGFLEKSMDELCNSQFDFSRIEGKRGLIIGDNDSKEIKRIAELKLLLSHEPISIEYKGKTSFEYRAKIPVLLMGNYGFRFADADSAMYRRLTVLECPCSFVGEHKRDYIKEDWAKTPEVARYFLRAALETAGESTSISDEERKHLRKNLNKLRASVSSAYKFWMEIDDIGFLNKEMPAQYYFDAYRSYCRSNGQAGGCNQETFMKQTIAWMMANPNRFEVVEYAGYKVDKAVQSEK